MTTGAVIARIVSQYSDKGSKAAQKDIAKTAKKIDDFNKKVVKAYAAGAAAAAFFAYKVGKFAVKSAVEDAKSQEALANILRTTTNATNTQIAAVEDYIDKQQLLTHVSDTDLRSSLGTLLTVTKDLSQAQYLNNLAVDIAAGANKDLSSVVNALAKASQGNLKPLQKLNIGLDNNTVAAKDFAGAYSLLEKTYGGAAEKIAKKDPFTKLKIQFSEIAEDIGTALLPALTLLAAKIQSDIVPQIEDWVEKNKTLITQSLLDLVATIENIAYYGFYLIKFLEQFKTLLGVISVLAPFGFIASQLMLVGKFTKGALGLVSKFFDKLILFGKNFRTALSIVKLAPATGFMGFWKNVLNIITLIVPQARLLKIVVTAVAAILGTGVFAFFFNKNNSDNVNKVTSAMDEQGRAALRLSRSTKLTAAQIIAKRKEDEKAAREAAKSAAEAAAAAKAQEKDAKAKALRAAIQKKIESKFGIKFSPTGDEYGAIQDKAVALNLARSKQGAEYLASMNKLTQLNNDLNKEGIIIMQRYADIVEYLDKLRKNDLVVIDYLAKKWNMTTEAADAYIKSVLAIGDNKIDDYEVILLAKSWGSTNDQARKYLEFFQAINDGTLTDAEIAKLQSRWNMTQKEVLLYADFVRVVNDGKLTDEEIKKLQDRWGLTVEEISDYIYKLGSPVSYNGTLVDPAIFAKNAWLDAIAALERYIKMLGGVPGGVPGGKGFIPGSGDDPAVIADAAKAAIAAAEAAADAANALAESEAAVAASKANAAMEYAKAKAAGDSHQAALFAAQVGPSKIAAGESGAIGAASIAAQLKAAEDALAQQRHIATYAAFKAKERADEMAAATASASTSAYDAYADEAEKARIRRMIGASSTISNAKDLSSGGNLMAGGSVNVTVNVSGSVTSEQDLVSAVRNGLLATQYNGNSLTLQAV